MARPVRSAASSAASSASPAPASRNSTRTLSMSSRRWHRRVQLPDASAMSADSVSNRSVEVVAERLGPPHRLLLERLRRRRVERARPAPRREFGFAHRDPAGVRWRSGPPRPAPRARTGGRAARPATCVSRRRRRRPVPAAPASMCPACSRSTPRQEDRATRRSPAAAGRRFPAIRPPAACRWRSR